MRTRKSDIPDWLELTRSPDPRERRKALQALCPCELKSKVTEVWQRVLEMAADPMLRFVAGRYMCFAMALPFSIKGKLCGCWRVSTRTPTTGFGARCAGRSQATATQAT